MDSGSYGIVGQSSEGKPVTHTLSALSNSGDYGVLLRGADGKPIAVKVTPLSTTSQYGFLALASDGKCVPVCGEEPEIPTTDYLMVGDSGVMFLSADGRSWVQHTKLAPSRKACWANGTLYVAFGGGTYPAYLAKYVVTSSSSSSSSSGYFKLISFPSGLSGGYTALYPSDIGLVAVVSNNSDPKICVYDGTAWVSGSASLYGQQGLDGNGNTVDFHPAATMSTLWTVGATLYVLCVSWDTTHGGNEDIATGLTSGERWDFWDGSNWVEGEWSDNDMLAEQYRVFSLTLNASDMSTPSWSDTTGVQSMGTDPSYSTAWRVTRLGSGVGTSGVGYCIPTGTGYSYSVPYAYPQQIVSRDAYLAYEDEYTRIYRRGGEFAGIDTAYIVYSDSLSAIQLLPDTFDDYIFTCNTDGLHAYASDGSAYITFLHRDPGQLGTQWMGQLSTSGVDLDGSFETPSAWITILANSNNAVNGDEGMAVYIEGSEFVYSSSSSSSSYSTDSGIQLATHRLVFGSDGTKQELTMSFVLPYGGYGNYYKGYQIIRVPKGFRTTNSIIA